MKIREIIKEEVRKIHRIFEAGPTRGFAKAAEAMYDAELQQQKLRKAFVAEKNPKKKEKLKSALILMHKKVQKLQSAFNAVLRDEPIDLEMEVKEAIELVHVYKNGKMFGTGELVKGKKKGNKVLVRYDGNKTEYVPEKDIKLTEGKMTKKHANLAIKQLKPFKSVENVKPHGEFLLVAYTNYKDRAKIIKQLSKLFDYSSDGRMTNAPRVIGIAGYNWISFVSRHTESVNESSSIWKALDAKWKLQDQIMDLEYDMKMITKELSQLHKDMEQEAEPEGGPKATKYGKEIEKKEKEYKKKKAEFKKLMAKLDKLEQF